MIQRYDEPSLTGILVRQDDWNDDNILATSKGRGDILKSNIAKSVSAGRVCPLPTACAWALANSVALRQRGKREEGIHDTLMFESAPLVEVVKSNDRGSSTREKRLLMRAPIARRMRIPLGRTQRLG